MIMTESFVTVPQNGLEFLKWEYIEGVFYGNLLNIRQKFMWYERC
jgi:hypothetical protein